MFRAYNSSKLEQESIPNVIYVHKNFTDKMVKEIQKVRREGQIPSITYVHQGNQCGIYRSAEPEPSLNMLCAEDIKYLTKMSELQNSGKPAFLYVFSARPDGTPS